MQGFDQPVINPVQRRLIAIELFRRFIDQIKAKQRMVSTKIARHPTPPRH